MTTAGSRARHRFRWMFLAVVVVSLAGCTSNGSATSSGPATSKAVGTVNGQGAGNSSAGTDPAAGSAPGGGATSATALPTISATVPAVTPTTAPTQPAGKTSTTGRAAPAPVAVTSTVTRTRPGKTVTLSVPPPKATHEPPAQVGDCAYLSADVVSDITGQHHGQTLVFDLQPAPMCVFYRSDGGMMGSVRVIKAASAAEAVAAVNQHVPIANSQPASQPAGWIGGSITTPGQMTQDSSANSIYAVSKGDIAIVAQEDESPSIKARVMAVCAIYGLKLEAGQAPDYCAGSEG